MLLVRAGGRVCAVPIAHVVETMRPLEVTPLAGTPDFVKGVTVVRGVPAPAIDLGSFLGAEPAEASRFVLVRCGSRTTVLAVERVLGVADAASLEAGGVPLLGNACAGSIELLGTLDRDLLVVLRTTHLVPESAWRALEGRKGEA